MAKVLHDHQQRAMDALRQSLAVKRTRPLLQAPTGAGKTVLAMAIIKNALEKRKRVWFVVPMLDLITQAVEEFWKEGIHEVGVIQANHPMTNYSKPVQVISVETLKNRDVEAPDLILVDEAHRIHEAIKKLMEDWPTVPFIGLSATPWTKGLGRLYDNLIISATTKDLIDKGFLCPFRVFAPSHPDLSGVKTTNTNHGRDYAEGDLSEAMQKGTLTADIVSTWRDRGTPDKTLCFAVDRAHAKALHERFESAGVRVAYQDARTTAEERAAIKRGFAKGEIKVVVNIATLTTGVDWDVRTLILARPTKSEILFTQIIGRALRTAPGKESAIILDHSDTTARLGFVTDIHHAHLDDGNLRDKAEATTPLPKECPDCTALIARFSSVCPECGHKFAPRKSDVKSQRGELVELDGRKKAKPPTQAEKRSFYAQLLGYAKIHRKNDKWVLAYYRQKFALWPDRSWDRTSVQPTGEVQNWIRSRQIAYAKRRQAEEKAV